MKKFSLRRLPLVAAVLLISACSTPSSRIAHHQAAFDSWPADVRQKVQAGRIDVGFTSEMVQVALGEPDRTFMRTNAQGTSEVWVYFDHGPQFAVGVGVGGYSRHTAYGTGVMVGNEAWHERDALRIMFHGGRVAAIEARRK